MVTTTMMAATTIPPDRAIRPLAATISPAKSQKVGSESSGAAPSPGAVKLKRKSPEMRSSSSFGFLASDPIASDASFASDAGFAFLTGFSKTLFSPAAERGRPRDSLSVRSWSLTHHPRPPSRMVAHKANTAHQRTSASIFASRCSLQMDSSPASRSSLRG